MAVQKTTLNVSAVSNTIIREARHVQEANAPSWNLIEKVPLPRGASTVRMPKVGQFTISDLVDGQDMTDEQEVGITYVDLTATERGAKIIVTKKTIRENGTTDMFRIIGSQFGAAGARKQDRDTQALYSGLNGGTAFGAAGATMSLTNFAAAVAKASGGAASSADSAGSEPFDATYAVQHPHAVYQVTRSATAIGAGSSQAVNDRREEKLLKRFFKVNFGGCDLFQSKNIYVDSSGDATGIIAQRDALVGLTSVGWTTEREYDASARGWEVNFTADYGVFELDDKHGAPLIYDAGTPNDTA